MSSTESQLIKVQTLCREQVMSRPGDARKPSEGWSVDSSTVTLPIESRTITHRAEGMYQVLTTWGVSEIGVIRRR